jgi:glycosyltransferase involved in cell wall biosynthesis
MIAEKLNIPTAVFTWENVLDKHFDKYHDDIEKDVIGSATILIAGTEGAKARMIHKGAAEDKVAVCPQTGINCELFKPMSEVQKKYTCGYFGRMVKEKGVEYIEKVVEELNLKMMWVGGRGTMIPSYGIYHGWIDYLKMPEYYNKLLLFVTYPNSYNGFYEQLNYSIPEAMACGIPVVSSTNGSIGEVYKDAPILFVEEANEAALSDAIKDIFGNPRETRIEEGIKWVAENLSVPVIARKQVEILENVGK